MNMREVHIVTQWKGGCVYRTRSLGHVICTREYAESLNVNHKNIQVGSVSTRVSSLIGA
jgi:hypothetical protein